MDGLDCSMVSYNKTRLRFERRDKGDRERKGGGRVIVFCPSICFRALILGIVFAKYSVCYHVLGFILSNMHSRVELICCICLESVDFRHETRL